MRCDATQGALIDFYYQELESEDHRSVSAHLVSCPHCAKAYASLHGDLSVLDDALCEAPSARLGAQLRERVEGALRPTLWQRAARAFSVRIPIYQAAAAALLIAGLWLGLANPGAPMGPDGALPLQGPQAEAPAPRDAVQVMPVNYDARTLMAVDEHIL